MKMNFKSKVSETPKVKEECPLRYGFQTVPQQHDGGQSMTAKPRRTTWCCRERQGFMIKHWKCVGLSSSECPLKTGKVKILTGKNYPQWVCIDCGTKAVNGRTPEIATWHSDTCGVCKKKLMVTEPRDFGHPIFIAKSY